MVPGAPRRRLADALGLGAILLVLLDLLHPSLLLLPTVAAGGDTPSHYPTAVWFHEHLLPQLRLHGWYPGASLGHPLLLYYFPFPFVLMSALAPLTGMPVAFKLGTALGVFLLPLLAYLSFRLMRLAFPAPLLAAAAALVFLYVEENPIWGGTIASTLTGEFSYTYGAGFAVLFLGVLVRARADGRGPWAPALVLALTSYAHGYTVLWAGLTASGVLLWDAAPTRRPWHTLGWLLAVAALAFALAGPALVPLLADWGWTTPYDDAWIDLTTRGFFPPLLVPLLVAGAFALVATLARGTRGRRADERLLLLGFGALAATALASAGPALGVIDVRFVPLAQLSLALAGAAGLGLLLARIALADVAALGVVLLAACYADSRSQVLRHWIDWNYSGLEAKELWPAWKELNSRLRGGPGDPRVAFEYGPVHERAGSIRMHETVPFFSGRSGIEGVYNQSSVTTHPVYYLLSELYPSSPNPFRSRTYSQFDPETGLRRLRLLNVGYVVAVTPRFVSALDARPEVVREAEIPPYTLYRVASPGPGYVEPLAFAPVRSPISGWRDRSFFWFSRKPENRAVLVFTDDSRFDVLAAGPWSPPPERPLDGGVEVRETVEAESIRITTSRPGHPLLVKVSYHPRWRAEGAFGPYLASPGFMIVVPHQREVRITYAARAWSDWLGLGLAAAGLLAAFALRRSRAPGGGEEAPHERDRVADVPVAALPIALVVALAALRLLPEPTHAREAEILDTGRRGPARERCGRASTRAAPRPRRPTHAGLVCCACRVRRCSGPATHGKRSSPSLSSWRGPAPTGRKPSTPVPWPGNGPAIPRAPKAGAEPSARSTRPRRGPRSSPPGRPTRLGDAIPG
jgi:hypothetical protein